METAELFIVVNSTVVVFKIQVCFVMTIRMN